MSIEWDHASKPIATVDSVEKSNGGIIITSSLNRSVYNDIFEKLKNNIDEAKDKWFHPYIIDDVHSATKEFINARYGTEKGHRDSMIDAMGYYGMWRANEKSEKKSLKELLKEHEEAELMNERFKRMLWNSHYGICQPSELIDSCERIDKYRKKGDLKMSMVYKCDRCGATGKIEAEGDERFTILKYGIAGSGSGVQLHLCRHCALKLEDFISDPNCMETVEEEPDIVFVTGEKIDKESEERR